MDERHQEQVDVGDSFRSSPISTQGNTDFFVSNVYELLLSSIEYFPKLELEEISHCKLFLRFQANVIPKAAKNILSLGTIQAGHHGGSGHGIRPTVSPGFRPKNIKYAHRHIYICR